MSALFDSGLGDYIGGSATLEALQASVNVSLFAWLNRRGALSASGSRMFELGSGTGDGVRLQFASADNKPNFIIARAGDKTTLGATAFTQDVWYHTGGTYDGTTRHVYVNGASEANSGTVSGNLDLTDEVFTIGNRNGTKDRGWYGEIAEFAIWNRGLTAAEAAILAKAYSPLFIPNGLIHYWPLIRANSTPAFNELINLETLADNGTADASHPRIIYPSLGQLRKLAAGGGVAAVAAKQLMQIGVG